MFRRLLLAGVFVLGVLIAPAIRAGATPLMVTVAPVSLTTGVIAPVPLNSSSCYWANCSQAHQNGEGDIPQGTDHYCSKQDRDGDGIACEW